MRPVDQKEKSCEFMLLEPRIYLLRYREGTYRRGSSSDGAGAFGGLCQEASRRWRAGADRHRREFGLPAPRSRCCRQRYPYSLYHKISHIPLGKRLGVLLGGAPKGIVQRFLTAAVETDRRAMETICRSLSGPIVGSSLLSEHCR